jgi:RNA-directed DNA polymerase
MINLDSHDMIPESDLELGQFRLLDVDNKMIVPVDTHIRLIVTANDVLHSFAVPSLGLKLDCTPGRLNQASILIDRTGTFYGQCSEICLWLGRWIDSGKEKLLLTYPTSRPTVSYDVLLSELGLRYTVASLWYIPMCSSSISHGLKIKQTRYFLTKLGKNNVKLKPFDRSLTSYRYYGGLSKKSTPIIRINQAINAKFNSINGLGLQINNILKQIGILVSNLKNICRATGIRNTLFKSVNLSKLGNPGFFFTIAFAWYKSSLNYVIILTFFFLFLLIVRSENWSNPILRVWRGQDGHQAYTTVYIPSITQNWPAYRICKKVSRSKIFIRTRGYNTSATTRPLVDKSLTQIILKQFERKEWLTPEHKRELNLFIEKSQFSLTEISKKEGMKSPKVRLTFETFIHTLLFQVYAIESLSQNSRSKTAGNDSLILNNTFESKYDLLLKLKNFRINKIQPIRRIYTPNNKDEKRPLSIPSILDLCTQQLVFLLLDPIIEAHSDLYSFGFRKGRNQIICIATIQKNLQSKPNTVSRSVDEQYIWDADIRKCSGKINHDWLLNNVPIPPKYLFLLKGWLKAGYIEFNSNKNYLTEVEPSRSGDGEGIISPLLINFTLNGMENILEEAKIEFKNNTKHASLRYRELDGWRLAVKAVSRSSKDSVFKERAIACKLIRFADDFIVISGSERLLKIIKSKIIEFLSIRGLEIHPEKSRTIKFGINTPFQFLGYTFSYLFRTNYVKSSYLHHSKPEYRLEGRPRLFVYPSTEKFNMFKRKLILFLRKNYNLTAYELVALLNPMITRWVNYYSFSNAGGTLNSLKKFLYHRLKIWLIKKHPRTSIVWLMKHFMLFCVAGIEKQHNLDSKTMASFKLKALNHESLRTNKWNFFGLAFKDYQGQTYEIPKLNVLKWPTNIKNIIVATVLAPSRSLLKTNYYTNKVGWFNLMLKREALHSNKSTSLFQELWKRDNALCCFCNNPLSPNLDDKIVIHHKVSWSETKSNKKDNLALAHESCHFDWHNSTEGKFLRGTLSNHIKFSKNRGALACSAGLLPRRWRTAPAPCYAPVRVGGSVAAMNPATKLINKK